MTQELQKAVERVTAVCGHAGTTIVYTADLRTILAALQSPDVVRVPREPTEEMMRAAYDEVGNISEWEAKTAYRAMLSAHEGGRREG